MGFNPKLLQFLPCHGSSHSSFCKPVLVSPETLKLSPVLFALPRDDEKFSSDIEEEEPIVPEDHTSTSPNDVLKEQSKKVSDGEVKEEEFVVREATIFVEFMASAMLKANGLYRYDLHDRASGVDSSLVKNALQECDEIQTQFKERNIQPFMCIIYVRNEGENMRTGLLKCVMGTLDFSVHDPLRGKTYPEEVLTATKTKTSKIKQRKSRKYGIISKMVVTKSAHQQDVDVGSSMLKFAIESAKDKGIKQVFILVSGDNKPALALYEKMGMRLTIVEPPRDNEEFSSDNKEEPIIPEHEELRTLIPSDNVHEEQLMKLGGGEVNKLEFVVREATDEKEFWSSTFLKAAGLYEYPSGARILSEFNEIKWRCTMRAVLPFMCIIAVRMEGENVLTGMPKNGIGTLDFRVKYLSQGEAYPKEIVMAKMIKTFQQRNSMAYVIIWNVAVGKSARVGSSMLKFVIEFAKEKGIPQIFLQVRRDNKPALALFGKIGFTITAAKATPLQEELSSSHALVYSPAAAVGFNPKFLHFLPCHGFSRSSSCKPVLVSPATMKLSPVLFALPRDDEKFLSGNEEEPIIQEHEEERRSSISSDSVHKERSKKVSGGEVKKLGFVVREATPNDFWASALLKAEGAYDHTSRRRVSNNDALIRKQANQEFRLMVKQYEKRALEKCLCIVAVRKKGESVIGTLDFDVLGTFPKKDGYISNVIVAKSARRQGVGSNMLGFILEYAKEHSIRNVYLYVYPDNRRALALYAKMGFKVIADGSDTHKSKFCPKNSKALTMVCSVNWV